MEFVIHGGKLGDYWGLRRFHYLGGRPGPVAAVWRVSAGVRAGQWELAGVLVLSWPVARCAARHRVFGIGREGLKQNLVWANEHIRTISRVVVHPKYRGLGLSSALVRHAVKHCPTRYIEGRAHMARALPFFAGGGMVEGGAGVGGKEEIRRTAAKRENRKRGEKREIRSTTSETDSKSQKGKHETGGERKDGGEAVVDGGGEGLGREGAGGEVGSGDGGEMAGGERGKEGEGEGGKRRPVYYHARSGAGTGVEKWPVTVARVGRGGKLIERGRRACPFDEGAIRSGKGAVMGKGTGGMVERFGTGDELHRWVKDSLGLVVPRRAFCAHHQAPFAYLEHAYFEPGGDVVVWGPRGGGKTRLAAAATLLDLLHKPGVGVRILGGSLEQSMRVWEHLLPDLERHGGKELEGAARSRGRRVGMASGGSAAVLTQSQRAVRGQHVQKMRCDEVEMFDPAVWAAVGPTVRGLKRADSPFPEVAGAVECFSTHHKVDGVMSAVLQRARLGGTKIIAWCILDVMARCEAERECGGCPLWEECRGRAKEVWEDGTPVAGGHMTVGDVIAMKRRVSLEVWETELLCLRPKREGAVFPHFDERVHVGEIEAPGRLSLGVDFGFVAPFVALWVGMDDAGRVCVVDEWIRPGLTVSEHIPELKGRGWPVAYVACDPAGKARNDHSGRSSVKLLKEAGYVVRTKSSGIGEGVELLRRLVRPAAGESRLVIHPRCAGLIAAMKGYRYGEGVPVREVPEKDGVHDHAVDALRYWVVNLEPAVLRAGRY